MVAAATLLELGLRPYPATLLAMQTYNATRTEDSADQLWLVYHPPVFTLGLAAKTENIINAGDIPVVSVDRGGDVTYHGPGQAVVYTLLDLARRGVWVKQWVNDLQLITIDFLQKWQIPATVKSGAPGVYLRQADGSAGAKIAALGLKVSRGRCYHGIALNIAMDLSPYQRINPCGAAGLAVSDMQHARADIFQTHDVDFLAQAFATKLLHHWNAL